MRLEKALPEVMGMSIWKVEVPCPESQVLRIDTCMKALSEYLFTVLVDRQCSIRELSRDCGLCARELEKIINRETSGIRLSTFLKIAQGLGIKTSILMEKMEGNI